MSNTPLSSAQMADLQWIDGLSAIDWQIRHDFAICQHAQIGEERVGTIVAFRSAPFVVYAYARDERLGPCLARDGRSALEMARERVERALRDGGANA